MKLTFDWNCVIEVEEGREQASFVTDLVCEHRRGEIEVALLATSASENSRLQRFPGSAELFKKRVAKLGWDDLPVVPMPAIFSLSYIDSSFIIDDREAFDRDKNALWQVISLNVSSRALDHLRDEQILNDESIQSIELRKWRNIFCDVMSAYSHIHAKRDIFVTNNTKDFQKNHSKLALLGMEHISTPSKTRALIEKYDNLNSTTYPIASKIPRHFSQSSFICTISASMSSNLISGRRYSTKATDTCAP